MNEGLCAMEISTARFRGRRTATISTSSLPYKIIRIDGYIDGY